MRSLLVLSAVGALQILGASAQDAKADCIQRGIANAITQVTTWGCASAEDKTCLCGSALTQFKESVGRFAYTDCQAQADEITGFFNDSYCAGVVVSSSSTAVPSSTTVESTSAASSTSVAETTSAVSSSATTQSSSSSEVSTTATSTASSSSVTSEASKTLGTSASSTSATAAATSTSAGKDSSQKDDDTEAAGAAGGLSKGAAVGIGVGVGVAVIAIVVVVLLLSSFDASDKTKLLLNAPWTSQDRSRKIAGLMHRRTRVLMWRSEGGIIRNAGEPIRGHVAAANTSYYGVVNRALSLYIDLKKI
uniref:Extracellular membrane protein CFEM domain-containing protein n=1 Tax=Bionectria ochroleuca TaxID=29856 RepID=A0A8H7KAH9_BIOOC